MAEASSLQTQLKTTPLHAWHIARGARMVPFAGYAMPVQYTQGVMAEHMACREGAALFDVSHMGQMYLEGVNAAKELELLVPGDIMGLGEGRMRYTQFTNHEGGILDDLMVTRLPSEGPAGDRLFLVVNAACKEADEAHLKQHIKTARLTILPERALIAVQGPKAGVMVASLLPEVETLSFMQAGEMTWQGHHVMVTRSGYTGEDGFEISIHEEAAEAFAEALVAVGVIPAGLGARDTLRLEAGLCLYGHDMDTTITPVEADLTWSIGKRRRLEGGFIGDKRILADINAGVMRKRVGLHPEGRAPIREGAAILDAQGQKIGHVTSGTFSPSRQAPIVMGYVPIEMAAEGTRLTLEQRGRTTEAHVIKLPFVPHRYKR